MKKIFLTLTILAMALGFAKGQAVAANTFSQAIDGLNTNISQQNLSRMNASMDQLNQLMSSQIAYMTNLISSLQAKAKPAGNRPAPRSEAINITAQQNKLTAEQQAYSKIQPLKGSVMANQGAINTNLRTFLGTL